MYTCYTYYIPFSNVPAACSAVLGSRSSRSPWNVPRVLGRPPSRSQVDSDNGAICRWVKLTFSPPMTREHALSVACREQWRLWSDVAPQDNVRTLLWSMIPLNKLSVEHGARLAALLCAPQTGSCSVLIGSSTISNLSWPPTIKQKMSEYDSHHVDMAKTVTLHATPM